MLADEVGAMDLADVLPLQQAKAAIDLGDHPGNGGLAGPGRSRKHQVVRALGDREPTLLADQFHGH